MAKKTLSRVLLVEDDPDIQAVARMTLEATSDFVVEVCSGGRQALDTVPTFQPDLIVLDVMMPDMDGPATLEALRRDKKTADIPVVFMTAKVQAEDRNRYREIGALGVIAKPFDPIAFAPTLKELWEARDERGR